ncbi:MAG TPA: MBL fold metallo-hydrolase [Ktedonobacterales bacterium]
MAQMVILGTAAALPTATQANTMLIVLNDEPRQGVMIDCGAGAYNALLRAGVDLDAFSDLFITHAHIDHIGDLPSLIESLRLGGRSTGLHIWGIPEVIDIARRLVKTFDFEITMDVWSFPITFHLVEPGAEIELGGYRAQVLAMEHSVPSVGVRLSLPHGEIAYTSDTKPCANIAALGSGAHMLIAECTFLDQHAQFAEATYHMTAKQVGEAARECDVRSVMLVHQGHWAPAEAIAEVQTAFGGQVVIPADGHRIDI